MKAARAFCGTVNAAFGRKPTHKNKVRGGGEYRTDTRVVQTDAPTAAQEFARVDPHIPVKLGDTIKFSHAGASRTNKSTLLNTRQNGTEYKFQYRRTK
jgi:hypothetical protein